MSQSENTRSWSAPFARREELQAPARAAREAAEMRGDVEAFDRAMEAWKADGRQTVPHAEIKRRFGLK